jgi:hypothetical protein
MVEMVTCSLGEEQRLNSEVNLRSILKTRTTDDVTVIRCKGRILSGHPKTGQRWSGQNRPTEKAGD